ncbi:MAG TPA: oligosaccharide flippase family protein [Saprospiraceae bacterium]|nr:oligosaccharide flippase family protein [Saprospiraceae bacterium]
MGVIQRQGIKHIIVSYLGTVVGALAILFVYPRASEIYGLVQLLISVAGFFSPIVMLGTAFVSVRYFPVFQNDKNGHNGFLGFILLLCFSGFAVYALSFPLYKDWLIRFFFEKQGLESYARYINLVVPLTLLLLLTTLFTLYASNFQRIVVPALFEEFLIKVVLPLLILFYTWQELSVAGVVDGVLITYVVAVGGLLIYIFFLGQLHLKINWKFLKKPLLKEMAEYGGFGILSGMGIKGAFNLDTIMVAGLVDLKNTGIYAIALFMAEALGKPIRSLRNISQPIIAKALNENDTEEIKKIYQRSSIHLLILGLLLFTGIWVCLDDVFSIMPNSDEMRTGKWVIFFLCMAKLVDLGTSVNNEIISYSQFYKFNLVTLIGLAVLNVLFNLWLIPQYQITGAAIATFLSFLIFNASKLIFIRIKFGILPFTAKTPLIFLAALLAYVAAFWIPDTGSHFLNILIKGSLVVAVFSSLVYVLKISPELNKMAVEMWNRIFARK